MSTALPSYKGKQPASQKASRMASASSRKEDTRCERLLRNALWRLGLRFRKNIASLAGKPDVVFVRARVAVFCDGDFWHGRNWEARVTKLQQGTNAEYWVAKIARNMERDKANTCQLRDNGWEVLRFWERDILRDAESIAAQIAYVVRQRLESQTK
jgi:DNA mismatch endonuclease, patch repair protein